MPEIDIGNQGIMIKCTPSKLYLNLLKTSNNKNDGINGGINGGINIIKTDSDIEIEILDLIKITSNITQVDLSVKLNVPLRRIQRCIANLKEKHILERRGSNKKGHWIINE